MRRVTHPEDRAVTSGPFEARVAEAFPELAPEAEAPEQVKFRGMAEGLARLRAGEITFTHFAQVTAVDWQRLAKTIFVRWPLPADVAIEDVKQELLLALVERRKSSKFQTLVEKWDPAVRDKKGRPMALARYCVWNAMVWACRWLHKRRGASRSREFKGVAGKAPGRFFKPVSAYESDERTLPSPVTQAGQETRVLLVEAIRSMAAGLRGRRTRAGFEALVNAAGDFEQAGKALHEASKTGRLTFRVRSAAAGRSEVEAALTRARRVMVERQGYGA